MRLFSRSTFFWICISYVMIVLINILGCIWHLIGFKTGDITDSWLSHYYGDLSKEELEDLLFWKRYAASIYWSMTTVSACSWPGNKDLQTLKGNHRNDAKYECTSSAPY